MTTASLNIGLVLPSVPGYSETFFSSKITGLQKNGHRVTLFVKNRKGVRDFICPVRQHPQLSKNTLVRTLQTILYFILAFIKTPGAARNMIRVTRKDGYAFYQSVKAVVIAYAILPHKLDWLHFGFAIPAVEREHIGKAIGAKVAVSFRGFDINQIPLTEGNVYKKLWPLVDKVHSISDYLITKAENLGLPKSTPRAIITPAIDAERFSATSANREPNSILLVSRLHWIKGIEHVIEALLLVQKSGIEAKMTIVGEGDEYERLMFAAYQLGIKNRVEFAGSKTPEQVAEYMSSHEMFIQYSHQEGFCNAALEAQSAGMLCIVSDADGLMENVVDGKTGWIVPKRNPQVLAEKIVDVLSLPAEEKEKIRNQARARVLRDFTLAKQEMAFIDFYTS